MGDAVPENRWETFAQEDAEWYIYTAPDVDFTTPEGRSLFERSGREDAAQILAEAGSHLTGHGRALEIGCGVGRLTVPVSEQFSEVLAVDIAPTMLRKLAENTQRAGRDNVRGFLSHEPWDAQGPVDLVYSLIVFQHIADWTAIVEYFSRIGACLAPGGVCWVQFDTRPVTLPYLAVGRLPDAVLPRPWRKGIRRIRRSRDRLVALFESCGLRVAAELRPGERHAFLLTR
ncbi:class I SAM-dependent methyltransferase [Paractinoplanes globisporus]|uniref:class I SAM-dependent methyltransferase n=1 Tax=Paractinoplanes globisporus TaxID=113565 RepID=UPI000368B8DE|nr:class I SAM-dependent methyltransferase [Actinoplanes globisporus]